MVMPKCPVEKGASSNPEDVNWGHVGTLEHYRARLREITDMAFREGEHAD